MDRRHLARIFQDRLKLLLSGDGGSTSAFVRDTGIDRSALSQFLDPNTTRLPRAEGLYRIASARGVTVDWLLGLDNAPEGRQIVATSLQIEQDVDADGSAPLDRWRAEAEGHKLRYVPSALPDMLSMGTLREPVAAPGSIDAKRGENVLRGLIPGDMDVEIAMPFQTLQDLSDQTGLWRGEDREECLEHLDFMADVCRETYPALRLHLFDGTTKFSAPFSVFGKMRVALFIGDAYLVTTAREQISAFVEKFDDLVRQALVSPAETHVLLRDLAVRD